MLVAAVLHRFFFFPLDAVTCWQLYLWETLTCFGWNLCHVKSIWHFWWDQWNMLSKKQAICPGLICAQLTVVAPQSLCHSTQHGARCDSDGHLGHEIYTFPTSVQYSFVTLFLLVMGLTKFLQFQQDLRFYGWILLLCSWWSPLCTWPLVEFWWILGYLFTAVLLHCLCCFPTSMAVQVFI